MECHQLATIMQSKLLKLLSINILLHLNISKSEETYTKALKELQLNSLINIHSNVAHFEKVYAWTEQVPVKKFILIFLMKFYELSLKKIIEKKI